MTSRFFMAAAGCFFASLPALSAAAPSCGKPFTARAFGEGAGKQGAEIACQGSMVRMVRPGAPGMMLVDMKPGGKAWFVYDDTRDYYEMPIDKKADALAFAPCRDLADLKKDVPGATCKKVGSETVNGRRTDKWLTKGEEGDEEVVEFFDPELNVPVKVVKGENVESELKDIRVGAVSGPMALPAGYRKLTDKEFTARAIEATKKAMGKKAG